MRLIIKIILGLLTGIANGIALGCVAWAILGFKFGLTVFIISVILITFLLILIKEEEVQDK